MLGADQASWKLSKALQAILGFILPLEFAGRPYSLDNAYGRGSYILFLKDRRLGIGDLKSVARGTVGPLTVGPQTVGPRSPPVQ